MSTPVLIAVFGTLGVLGAAIVGVVGVAIGQLGTRITGLEEKLAKVEARERAVWWWARAIADLYYRHRKPGAPDLPPPPNSQEEE